MRVALVLLMAASVSIVTGTAPAAAQSTGTATGWASFLDGHPELSRLASGGRAAAAVARAGGALEAGAFLVGYEIGYNGMEWLFGSQADNRSMVQTGFAFWRTDNGSIVPYGNLPGDGTIHQWPGNTRVYQNSARTGTHTYVWEAKCVNPATAAYVMSRKPDNAPDVITSSTGIGFGSADCRTMTGTVGASNALLDWIAIYINGQLAWNWDQDITPNVQWTVTYHTSCVNPSTGQRIEVTGTPTTTTPAANATGEVTAPECPSPYVPDYGWMTGGRAGDPVDDVIGASLYPDVTWDPVTRTGDVPAPIVPPDTTTPASPVPGTIGAGTTVHNPDGSTTTTQTQTMPDGTTRTVTTTTHPDGSKTVTTQPLNPDGTPNGAPAVVTIPAPGTGQESGTESAGCMGSWTWNPVAWVYRPVKCALQWAFVPSPAAVANVQTQAGALGDSVPFSYVGDVVGWVDDLAVTEDCVVIDFPVPAAWEGTAGNAHQLRVLDSCNPAGRPEAFLITGSAFGVPIRPLLEVAIWAGFLLGIAWWAWKAYAPGSTGVA